MRKREQRVIGFLGLVLIGTGVFGIIHFVVSAAGARFPAAMLTSIHNWIFIGLHAILGALGLAVLGLRKRVT